MSAVTVAPRVVIAGAGPGGLAAASLLRASGAEVTVLERGLAGAVDPARRSGVVVNPAFRQIADAVGAGGVYTGQHGTPLGDGSALASLQRLMDLGRAHAQGAGADIVDGARLLGVTSSRGGTGVSIATQDAATGAQRTIDADWFIDATGGRSPVSASEQFARVPYAKPGSAARTELTLVAAEVAPRSADVTGWNAAASFGINNAAEGVAHAYIRVGNMPELAKDPAAIRAFTGEMLTDLGLTPGDLRSQPRAVTVRQTLAPHAAEGRTLLIGDSVGTVLPSRQMGVSLAWADAERAATTILAAHAAPDDAARAALVNAYDARTVAVHRAYMG